ncbi:MAG: RnfABCDGE type electron transport complex subunit D, partial [Synergistaceae bacterium]|nr:RnfABCDGE type electron transport complex subunit D [Synergistaceae bacterium]
MSAKLVVSSSPHVHSEFSTQKIMGMVIYSLIPAGIMGVYFLGLRS